MNRAPALLACLALTACSRPVVCEVATVAPDPKASPATGYITNSQGIVIRVTKQDDDGYAYKLIGVMENVSGQHITMAEIRCKFTDAQSHTISVDDDAAYDMAPGEAKNLSISLLGQKPAGWSCWVRSAR